MARIQRPGPLTAIALVAILLGGVGSCVSIGSVGSLFLQGPIREFQRATLEHQPAQNREQLERQMELQEQLEEEMRPYQYVSVPLELVDLLASFALAFAGVLLFRWSRRGPRLFAGAAYANLAIDVGATALGLVMAIANREVMADYMRDVAAADPNAQPGMGEMMGAIGQASMGMQVCTVLAIFAIKAAFYVAGIVYLRKPEVRALYDEAAEEKQAPAGS
ncbi:MAG TPA: hypothetical protein RMH99_08465 [Sandaracinaceae bacterium LLY-WYZ-13_1]|nr:hypothetical protein [Sandaracinaceae bacterium LLY-WYZ-13_1]